VFLFADGSVVLVCMARRQSAHHASRVQMLRIGGDSTQIETPYSVCIIRRPSCVRKTPSCLRRENARESVQPMMHTILGIIIKHPWHSGVMTSVCGEQDGKRTLFQCDTNRANEQRILHETHLSYINSFLMMFIFYIVKERHGMVKKQRGKYFYLFFLIMEVNK